MRIPAVAFGIALLGILIGFYVKNQPARLDGEQLEALAKAEEAKAAEAQRKREVAEAAKQLKLKTDEDLKEEALLARQKKKEAEKARKEYDTLQAQHAQQREEARKKANQQGKEVLIKGQESSIAVAKMKQALEEDEAKAKLQEWKDRQARHHAEEEAARQHQLETQQMFNSRPHGAHLHTPMGDTW